MNTKNIFITILAIALIAVGAYAFSTNRTAAPSNEAVIEENSTGTSEAVMQTEEDSGPAFKVVTLTDNGFSPALVTIARGETVRFVNDSSRSMWVGADEHPTHTEYDGTSTREHCANGMNTGASFDQCTSVAKGAFWDFTFNKSGTFGYHNHVGASNTGTVVVQ